MGKILIWLALGAAVFSFWSYLGAVRVNNTGDKKKNKVKLLTEKLRLARLGYYAMVAFISLASIFLLYLILSHQFQYEYVFKYSSRNLSFGLLLSTFWAGQAGSFLFWALCIAVMGVVFIKKTRDYEASAMLFVTVILGFFIVLLLKATPFNLQLHIPPDGQGLNPLLQNFWMVIHPPILFLGYAAAVFPFALALAALFTKQYSNWAALALPWALFNSVMPWRRYHSRRLLGVWYLGLGWILGLGSGRKFIPCALDG